MTILHDKDTYYIHVTDRWHRADSRDEAVKILRAHGRTAGHADIDLFYATPMPPFDAPHIEYRDGWLLDGRPVRRAGVVLALRDAGCTLRQTAALLKIHRHCWEREQCLIR